MRLVVRRHVRAVAPLLTVVGLLLGVLGVVTASADSGQSLPKCEDLLHGPPKEVAASKVIDDFTVNGDHSVTMTVTVSWSFAVLAKPGEHVFDCVWDGQPGQGSVVGSTGHPGADCSAQGLPCRFTVTTQPLSTGSHTLCDVAKILGTWPQPGTRPSPSGSRTPAPCVTAEIPPPPPSSPPPGTPTPPTNSGTAGTSATQESVPGLPATGRGPINGLLSAAFLAAGAVLVVLGLGITVRVYSRRA